jgi:hypothetical protein
MVNFLLLVNVVTIAVKVLDTLLDRNGFPTLIIFNGKYYY